MTTEPKFPKAEVRAHVAALDDGALAAFILGGRHLIQDSLRLALPDLALSWTCLVSVGLAEHARRNAVQFSAQPAGPGAA